MCLGMSPTDRKLKTMRLWRAHETPMKLVWIQPSLSLYNSSKSVLNGWTRIWRRDETLRSEINLPRLAKTCQDLPRLDCQGLRYHHSSFISTFISTFCMLREHRERCAWAIWGALIRLLGLWSRGGHFANLGKHLWTFLNNWMQYASIRFNQIKQMKSNESNWIH